MQTSLAIDCINNKGALFFSSKFPLLMIWGLAVRKQKDNNKNTEAIARSW